MTDATAAHAAEAHETENVPSFWLVAGLVVSVIGGVLVGVAGDNQLGQAAGLIASQLT